MRLDEHLIFLINNFGIGIYGIIFLVIFCETGLVFTPFLPGDSLLFVLGTLAGTGLMDISALFLILVGAAFVGDNTNYWIGRYLGKKLSHSKFVKKEYLDKTKGFYEKYGVKTIIIARFIPIIRTFAPFVAGIGEMKYSKFIGYSIIATLAWVTVFLFGGYYFGGIPIIKENLTITIFVIIFLSLIPAIIEFIKARKS